MNKTTGMLMTFLALACLGFGGHLLFSWYDNRFPPGRMWETDAIRPYEAPIPYSEPGRVPWGGGEMQWREAHPLRLSSPLTADPQDSIIEEGRRQYMHYCSHCHGAAHDGNATVGQSFAPLPGDLRSEKVQQMPQGLIFHEISYGIPGGRQPPLATTISAKNRWRIVAYVKSLGLRSTKR